MVGSELYGYNVPSVFIAGSRRPLLDMIDPYAEALNDSVIWTIMFCTIIFWIGWLIHRSMK